MSFEDCSSTLPETEQIAENTVVNLPPEKSRAQYEKQYTIFEKWCVENKMEDTSENTLLTYFEMQRKKCKPSTLWTIYSMLRSCLNIHRDVDISKYRKLQALLKRSSQGYIPKKSKILEEEDIYRFINEANDKEYLAIKVILIIGYVGACRRKELTNICVDDIEYRSDSIVVSVPKTTKNVARMFAITDRGWMELIKKYSDLRPKASTHKRFFLTYRNGYCVNTPIGINTMGNMPKEIATFLRLPDPHLFTSHCFRRSNAKHVRNSGGDLFTIKRLGGWKNSTVTEGYIDEASKMCALQMGVILPECSSTSTASNVSQMECDQNQEKNNITVADCSSTSPEMEQLPENTVNLLSEKSRVLYEKQYTIFEKWCMENKMEVISENTLLAYFEMQRKRCKPSSLWALYSMLRSCMNVHKDVDISKYQKLQALLKRSSQGYVPKKSKILEKEDIYRFIKEANDREYLVIKVILIIGYIGACRRKELINICVDDIEYRSDSIIVSVPKTTNNISRMFAITDKNWMELIKKYRDLRPKGSTHKRFFLTYRNGHCVNTPIGINTMGNMPKEIATFLRLPDPHLFTSHCFRRSNAKHIRNSGGDLFTIKRLSGWKSSTVAVILPGCSTKSNNIPQLECDRSPVKNNMIAAAPGSSVIEENSGENSNTATSLPADTNAHLQQSTTEGSMITGNRITNFSYIFSQLKIISAHGNRLGCTFQNLVLEKEVRWGLYTKLFLKCEKCNETFNIENVDNNLSNESNINNAAVKGIRSIGRGLDDLEKFLGNLDIPYMSQKTHEKHHNVDAAARKEVSVEVMKAKMSRKLSNDENTLPQKKQKMDDDVNTNSSSEPKIKTESPDSFNYEVTVKQEEVCIKDEIVEEEVLQPSTSFASKNETTTDDTIIKKEITEPSFDRVFQLKITLELDCWRKIQVPGYYNFRDLHVAIQKSMGWKSVLYDYHLHKFEMINPATNLEDSILMPDDIPFYKGLMDGEVKNELNTKIAHYFKSSGDKARYEYDFGMGWDHEVVLEKILIPKEGETYPKCIAWKGKCPPEDGVLYCDEEKVDFDPLCCFKS